MGFGNYNIVCAAVVGWCGKVDISSIYYVMIKRISIILVLALSSCVSHLTDREKELHEALTRIDVFLKIDPNDAELCYWKAQALFQLTRYDESIKWASKGIETHADIPQLYCVRGDAYFAKMEYEAAEKDYEKLHELWPAWDNSIDKLWDVRKKLGKNKN